MINQKNYLKPVKSKLKLGLRKRNRKFFEELKRIEERIKRTFDAKYGSKETKASQEKHESEEHDEQEDHGDHFDEVLTELPTANEEKEDKQDIEKEIDIKVQTEPAQQCESNKEIQNDTTETVDHNIDENKVSQEIVLLNENLNGVNDQNSTKVEGETIL
ncbi:hypothetical protein NQ317_008900 [Molorchus minor]|uniref:Uncharacterized protein n=1 Tax=Molorchus minor TaxID=1323400 RepID=A0ABQ9IXI2_9CUCU|nr:hypothetical protein NQ317_008900 [Molorchus minor]